MSLRRPINTQPLRQFQIKQHRCLPENAKSDVHVTADTRKFATKSEEFSFLYYSTVIAPFQIKEKNVFKAYVAKIEGKLLGKQLLYSERII